MDSTGEYYDLIRDPELTRLLSRDQIHDRGTADTALWPDYGELFIDSPERPGEYYSLIRGTPAVSEPNQRVERTDTWEAWTPAQIIQRKNAEIDEQIPQPSYAQSVRDSLASRDVLLAESAATAKRLELENTADENLPDFDATLTPAEPEAGDHCRLSLEIARLPEWAGQPGADIGFRATLEIQESHEDDGATARMIFTEIPTNEEGGVLGPFIQQPAPDDKIWILDSRDGYHWTDPDLIAAGYLFWDSGTRKVTPVLTAHGIGEGAVRSSVLVDYTVT
jgi:hypothetical protein